MLDCHVGLSGSKNQHNANYYVRDISILLHYCYCDFEVSYAQGGKLGLDDYGDELHPLLACLFVRDGPPSALV